MLIELTSEAPIKTRAILSIDFFTDADIGGEYINEVQIVGGRQFFEAAEDTFSLAGKFVAKDNAVKYLQSVYPLARVRELCD